MGKARQVALTDRDRELLETLSRRVRALSADQIARTWWSGARRSALARMRVLESAGYVRSRDALVHPELRLSAPMVSWRPPEPTPPFGIVAHRLRTRWTREAEPEIIFVIEERVATTFGGSPAPPLRTDELTHDLHLAGVYLHYREHAPDMAPTWVGERVIRKTRTAYAGPVPDAVIGSGTSMRYVEFAGAYTKERLLTFHTFCKAQNRPYELW